MRYIELNPVRAGMVDHPSEYPWSSYHYNAQGAEDGLITPHREYKRLDKVAEERQSQYRQLFRIRIAEKTLEEIRNATNKAWVLGNNRFKARIEKQLDRRVAPRPKGGDRKSEDFQQKPKINRV